MPKSVTSATNHPGHSCLYQGTVWHTRRQPREHRFRYKLYMLYLDLDELPTLFRGSLLFGNERRRPAAFRRSDHFGAAEKPLADCVRQQLHEALDYRPDGPIRLLTQVRCFGWLMNPVSFYYCFSKDGRDVTALLAEVNNTPWGERHLYALDLRTEAQGDVFQATSSKDFHVSPFMPLHQTYRWEISTPAEQLRLVLRNQPATAPPNEAMQTFRRQITKTDRKSPCCTAGRFTPEKAAASETLFEAGISMHRRELTSDNLRTAFWRHPLMTWKVSVAIYWQALCLWLRKTPFVPHPRTAPLQDGSTLKKTPPIAD